MEMTGFVVIMHLIFCYQLTMAEEYPRLSLLAKEDNVYCTAPDSPSAALVLHTTDITHIAETESRWNDDDDNLLMYDFITETGITNWNETGDWQQHQIFSQIDVLPLFDYHWEGLPVHYNKLSSCVWYGNSWDMTISIRARGSVSMRLSTGHTSSYYNITLAVSEKHSITFCPASSQVCYLKAASQRMLFDGSEWSHVTLAMRHSVLKLKLHQTNNKSVEFLKVTDVDITNYLYLLNVTSSYSPAQFKIHKYNVLGIHFFGGSMARIESPEFKPTYYPVCISVLSLIWPGKKESFLRVTIVDNDKEEDLMTVRPLEEVAWQEVRGIYTPNSRSRTVRVRITPQHTNYYLIGAVRECNPMGDVRVISTSIQSGENSTISCAFLLNHKKTITKRTGTGIRSECQSLKKCTWLSTTCNKFSVTERHCSDAILCEKTSDCCCEPKYVKPCLYEDFEAAVNVTVASVGEGLNNDCIVTHWPDPCHAYNFTITSKLKTNDSWKEVETDVPKKMGPSVLWDDRLAYAWCGRLNRTYMLQINYTVRIPLLGELHHHAEVIAGLSESGAPDPPLALKAANVGINSVSLKWLLPLRPNGKLQYFQIEAEPQNSFLRYPTHSELLNVSYFISSEYCREYSYLVKNLNPSTDYKISVRAHNIYRGQAASLKIRTLLAKPSIGPEFLNLQNLVTNGSVLIQLPPFDRNLTDESVYFLIGTSHSAQMEKLENVSLKNQLLSKTNIQNENMCWFVAQLNLLWDGPINFTVGDNSTSVGSLGCYWNRPLNPQLDFTISLVAINQHEHHFEYEVRSLEFDTNAVKKRKMLLIVGTALMLLICTALLASIFYLKRKKILASYSEETLEMELEKHSGGTDTASLEVSNRVLVRNLESYVKSIVSSGVLEEHFSLLTDGLMKPCSYALLPENKAKNRYQNIIPYDDNRVILQRTPKDSSTDYINASYIDGYNSSRFYIATQGPKRSTLIDFWKMVWQEDVSVIVMATNVTEKNKVVCEQYWPELQQEVRFGPFSVFNTSTQQLANYTFRVFCLTFEGSTRMVHHLHFTSWPNHRVPYHIQPLAIYMKKLQAWASGTAPVIVHCSAGSGRTGTIILADMCLRMANAEGCVDVLGCMSRLRQQRFKMVGNVEQYKLVYFVLLDCLNTESTQIPCDADFTAIATELYVSGKLHDQFENLKMVRWQDEVLKADVENDSSLSQVFCPVYMDGFLSKKQFIALGLPQKAVVESFWKMVAETKVSVIILLNDEEVNMLCPSEGHSLALNSRLTVTTKVEQFCSCWKQSSVQIKQGGPVEYTVSVLHFKDWPPSCELPKFPETLLELWEEMQRRRQNNLGPIVLLSESSASVLFAALVNVLEKVEVEHVCDVSEAVRTVHTNLNSFSTTEKQFLFLHEAVVKYLETYGIYANVMSAHVV